MMPSNTQIRWMIRRDTPRILEIDRESYEWAWMEEDFLSCLRQRNCIGMVIEEDHAIAGYMVYELYKTRLEILRFGVAPEFRRRGHGTAMIQKLVNKLSQQRRSELGFVLRDDQLDGQLFLRDCGLRCEHVLREHFHDGTDGYRFMFRLPVAVTTKA